MKRLWLLPWLSLAVAVLALLCIPFGPVFSPTFGDFADKVQVYGGTGFGLLATSLGIAGIAIYRTKPMGLTILSALGTLLGSAVVAFFVVAYAMDWLGP